MRRSIALPAVVALLASLTGACGIPDETGVKEVGPGRSNSITSGSDGNLTQVSRQDHTEEAAFAVDYLKAAAGDLPTAVNRLKDFMTPAAAGSFKPNTSSLQVIRVVDTVFPPASDVVKVTYVQVGTLDEFGQLEPAREAGRVTTEIKVTKLKDQSGLFVSKAPSALLLDVEALKSSYLQHPIYFWNTDYTALVPDVRYLPRALPVEQRPTIVLTWLTNGPAGWLSVADLAKGTALKGNVPAISDNKLQIHMTTQAVPAENAERAVDRLRRQIQWTLRPLLPSGTELDLKINNQDVRAFTGDDYLVSNPAAGLVDEKPEWFVVFGNRIRRVSESSRAVDPVPVLLPEENKDVRSAAISTSPKHTFAAVVVKAGKSLGLRVATAPVGGEAPLRPITGLSGALSRPVWAITDGNAADGAVGLIVANDKLFAFPPGAGAAREIPWTGPGGKITSVAVAPDGRRVVLVVDGKLYRAALITGGDAPSLGTPQQLRPASLSSVSAVDFNNEGWLTVAGVSANRQVAIEDMTIDGALEQNRLADLGDRPVDSLDAYPANPAGTHQFSRAICYTSDGKAWEKLYKPDLITGDRLSGGPGNAPATTVPTAPFYLE
jgi:hypothetical protein